MEIEQKWMLLAVRKLSEQSANRAYFAKEVRALAIQLKTENERKGRNENAAQ